MRTEVPTMTVVLGSTSIFGYGSLISDVRVTVPGNRYLDVLQKVDPVGPMMIAGFCGSMAIGFALMDDMRRVFGAPQPADSPDHVGMWGPEIAGWRWRRHRPRPRFQLLIRAECRVSVGSRSRRCTRC